MISLKKYFSLSVLAASAVIYHAFATRRQFFPATVYLSTSKLAVAAVGNLSFAMALGMYNLVIKVFLGTLREIELERVKEKLSSAIMETCLALTIFREEFNMTFVGMFTVLTFVKVFHWLVQDRVDYIEVTPSVSRLAHVRIVSFLLVLLGLDILFLHETIASTLAEKGRSVQLLFAFEYIILASAAAAALLKYVLSMVDTAMEGRWDGKGTYVFYLELLTDMLHLFVYCIFFVIVFTNYGLPLHLIRDLYMTFRNFRNRITDFLRFRQVTARMDRFPDATQADLARCDGICIICREEMAPAGLNKKLHCGHVFHLHCLRSWLERQQNCPTCRTSVFRPPQQQQQQQPAGQAAAGPAAPAAAPAADGHAPAAAGAAAAQPAMPGAAAAAAHAATPPMPPASAAAPAARGPAAAGGQAGVGGFRASVARAAAPGSGRSRSPRRPGSSGHAAGTSAAAAAAATATDPATVTAAEPAAGAAAAPLPPGIPGFWSNAAGAAVAPAGLVWQMPQWYPVTSMAAFSNAPLQYAGQQSALEQAQAATLAAASMVPMVPAIIPAISAPFPALIPPVAPTATPEQAHAAAAAAAMAAAAAAMYMPPMMPGLAMMPPAMLPAAAPGSAQEQMAAAAAANAAAAAAAAAVMGGAAPPEVMQASFEATQQVLQRQLDYLQSQMNRIRSSGNVPASAAAPAAQEAPAVPAAPAAPAAGVAAPAAQEQAGASPAAAVASGSTAGASSSSAPAVPTATGTAVAAGKEAAPAAPAVSADGGSSSSNSAAPPPPADATPAGAGNQVEPGSVPASEAVAGSSDDAAASADADELRRRRLQHFENGASS